MTRFCVGHSVACWSFGFFFFFFFSTGFRRFAFYALHLAIIQAHRVLGLTASYGYIAWEVLCLTGLFNGYIII